MTQTNVTITVNDEDHTLGNLLRAEFLRDSDVVFSAYNVPHPLTKSVQIRLQTLEKDTKQVLADSVQSLVDQVDELDKAFNDAIASS